MGGCEARKKGPTERLARPRCVPSDILGTVLFRPKPAEVPLFIGVWSGAANRIRTCDPVITNDVLYQLSYCGGPNAAPGRPGTPAPDIGHGPDWQEKRGLFWF